MVSKERLHNFQNSLLYNQGYKNLQIEKMYDAVEPHETTDAGGGKALESQTDLRRDDDYVIKNRSKERASKAH